MKETKTLKNHNFRLKSVIFKILKHLLKFHFSACITLVQPWSRIDQTRQAVKMIVTV